MKHRRKMHVPATKGHNDAGGVATPLFTAAELAELSVPDDVRLMLADDVPDVEDGARGPRSELPHWATGGPEEGAAIALWQMLAPPPGVEAKLPSWLRKMGISYFRGWIRHAGPVGPDFVMDWAIPLEDGTYLMHRDGDAGPFSPPPFCDLQTFVDAVVSLSRALLVAELDRKMRIIGRRPGDPDATFREHFPLDADGPGNAKFHAEIEAAAREAASRRRQAP